MLRRRADKAFMGSYVRRRMQDESAFRQQQRSKGNGARKGHRASEALVSLLWVQQKEKDQVLSMAAIPTELNCVDVGAKNLTRKRFFGLLYTMKVINSLSERVGREGTWTLSASTRSNAAQRSC